MFRSIPQVFMHHVYPIGSNIGDTGENYTRGGLFWGKILYKRVNGTIPYIQLSGTLMGFQSPIPLPPSSFHLQHCFLCVSPYCLHCIPIANLYCLTLCFALWLARVAKSFTIFSCVGNSVMGLSSLQFYLHLVCCVFGLSQSFSYLYITASHGARLLLVILAL